MVESCHFDSYLLCSRDYWLRKSSAQHSCDKRNKNLLRWSLPDSTALSLRGMRQGGPKSYATFLIAPILKTPKSICLIPLTKNSKFRLLLVFLPPVTSLRRWFVFIFLKSNWLCLSGTGTQHIHQVSPLYFAQFVKISLTDMKCAKHLINHINSRRILKMWAMKLASFFGHLVEKKGIR